MDYIILIGVIAVLALAGLNGYRKGLVKIVLSMVAMIVTVVLAGLLTIPVSGIIKSTTPIYDTIEKSVGDIVKSNNIDVATIDKLNLPQQLQDKVMEGADKAIEGFNNYIVTTVSDMILKALTFFILIIVIYVAVSIVIKVFDFISKLPVINSINKTGGLVVGLAQGLIVVWIACLVVTAFGDKAWAQETFRQINDNSFLTFIYSNNPIIYIVTKFI